MPPPYRFLIVNENYLGHATMQRLLCRALDHDPEVTYDVVELNRPAGLFERLERYVAGLRFPNAWIRQQNLDLGRLRFQRYVATLARRRVLAHLTRAHYDAICFHTQTAALRCGDLMARVPSLVSLDITNAQASREWNLPATRWTYLPNIRMEQAVLRRAAAISTLSGWARHAVLSENPGIDSGKVRHFPPGVDLTPFLDMGQARAVGAKPQLLFVGGDFARKGGWELLDVFRRYFTGRATLHLVTQADIPPEPDVHLHQALQPYSPELIRLYREADLFVLPTRNEAYGHVFIEAMAAGLPVVATDINAIPEIVRHEREGLLIPPENPAALREALERLLSNPNLRQELGGRGRERAVTEFNAERCFGRYVDCLKAMAR
jgi:starch synthase